MSPIASPWAPCESRGLTAPTGPYSAAERLGQDERLIQRTGRCVVEATVSRSSRAAELLGLGGTQCFLEPRGGQPPANGPLLEAGLSPGGLDGGAARQSRKQGWIASGAVTPGR